jgi:hypothetical protein
MEKLRIIHTNHSVDYFEIDDGTEITMDDPYEIYSNMQEILEYIEVNNFSVTIMPHRCRSLLIFRRED